MVIPETRRLLVLVQPLRARRRWGRLTVIDSSLLTVAEPESSHSTTICADNNPSPPTPANQRIRQPRQRPAIIRFAHPAEAEIARLLDIYGVRWQYEPITFSLRTSNTGQPLQSFTPDFYLPDHDLFIEMTTMRQSLVTRKNRKFRLLRELYPELNVKLLYRKDVEHILERLTRPAEDVAEGGGLRQVVREEQIQRRCLEMAETLLEWDVRPICLLGLGDGSVRTRDLIAARVAEHGPTATVGLLTVRGFGPDAPGSDVALDLASDIRSIATNIVLVADIVGTGLTALTALRWLEAQGIGGVRLVALLDRRTSRLVDVPLELAGFPASLQWHVGAGLGNRADLRDLPDLHIVISPASA